MTIQQGTRLGRYEIKSPLGAGGMGEVYLARDTQLDRPVALKLLPSEYTCDESRLHRFAQEAKAASALNHPNIVTIYEIGESDAGRFIAMELIEGQTLHAIINPRPSLESLVQFTSQVAKALHVAHAAGIVHRDIKPENIMVRDDGYIKVLDFGLARLVPGGITQSEADTMIVGSGDAALTATGVILGSVRYMSPEQARGERVVGATDIFSLGILLYELATGRHPFEADSQIGVLNAILTQSVIPPRRVNPEIPLALEALILQMLEKDSRLRPGAAEVDLALIESVKKRAGPETGLTDIPFKRHTVGHENERSELRRGFEAAAAGRGLILCVAGEPGIGKTTLIEDFLAELTLNDKNCLVARGRCSERLAGTEAYLPFLEALESLLHVNACESVARLMKLMAPTWYVQIIPFANEGSADRLQADAKAASQEWMKRELGSFLQEVSHTRPLVLFLDDLHWSDASTVELLAYLAGRLESMRMLILTTYRFSELMLSNHPFLKIKLDLQSRNICREVELQFLSQEDIAHYLRFEFPEHRFPIELPTLIHGKTEGSPLFMVDLVRYLRDRKVISQQQGNWVLAQSAPDVERELPESVRSMIQRKIDQLNEEDRRLLVAASVQGYEFDSAVLAKVLVLDADDVEERLEALERIHAFVRLIDEREFPDLTLTVRYRFVHVLYQNALYSSLRPTRKASLSTAVANALLDHYKEQSLEIASELAFLFKAARSFDQAAEYFLVAAQNAARVYANQEAIMFSKSAAEMVSQLLRGPAKTSEKLSELSAEIHERLGDILEITGKHDEARESYGKALDHVSKDETVWMARLHRNLGKTWQTQRQSDLALKAFAEAEVSLGLESESRGSQERQQEWYREWIQIQLEKMWVFYWLALVQELNDLAMKTQPIVERYGSQTQHGRFFHMLMLYHLRRDRYVPSDETLAYAEAALTAIQDSDELGEVAAIRFGTGFTYLWLENLDKAEEHFKGALHLANRRGDSLNQVLCMTYLTVVYRKRGQLEEAQSYILQSMEAATAGQMMPYIGMANANKAWVGWRQKDYSRVKECGRAALDSWQQGQASYPFQWAALWPLIGAELAQNNISEAIEYAKAMLAPTQQRLPTEILGVVEEAINEWRRNQLEATRTRLDRALTLAQEMGYL